MNVSYMLLYYSGPDVPVVELPEIIPYFDLEGFLGVEELKREKDANSEPISIPHGILFGGRIVTTAYVSDFAKISCKTHSVALLSGHYHFDHTINHT